ncbi:MAG TPA: hypothetical protein VGC62_14870 [Pseudomonas sp.]|uniref:hypothetical protein n=1 Tax=Pseudomonas sp. TaxID=306 RepID=UPI002ED98E21
MNEQWNFKNMRSAQEFRDKLAIYGPSSAGRASPLPVLEYDTNFGTEGKAVFDVPGHTLTWASYITLDDKKSKFLVSVYETLRAPHDEPKYSAIVRITAQGEIDTSFGPNNDGYLQVKFEELNYTMPDFIHEMSDGRLVISGNIVRVEDSVYYTTPMITRLKPDGTPDPDFANNGILDVAQLLGMNIYKSVTTVLPNGKILLLVLNTSDTVPHSYLVRLSETGTLDTSFQGKGYVEIVTSTNDPTYMTKSNLINNAGDIVLSGASQLDSFMTRRNADGNTEYRFGNAGVVSLPVSSFGSYDCSTDLNTSHLLVCGSSDKRAMLAHYKVTGEVEVKFNDGKPTLTDFEKGFGESLWEKANIQPDSAGKILTVGTGFIGATTSWSVMGRYLRTGELDHSFANGAGLGSPIDAAFFGGATAFITTNDNRVLCPGLYQGSAAILAFKV